MYRNLLLLALLLALAYAWGPPRQQAPTPTPGAAPQEPTTTAMVTLTSSRPTILSPRPGQALQGAVTILVDTMMEGFQSAELSFAYTGDPTQTWFLILQTNQPISSATLVEWDTGTISDGDYTLRLIVTLMDSSQQTTLATGLRVRNYTLIETETPTSIPPTATRQPSPPPATPRPTLTSTPTATTLPPTRTPLPPNAAILTRQEALVSLGKGALAVLGFFALLGVYQSIRSLGRRR